MAGKQRESSKRILGELDIDVSPALKGLKAVKRAANEAVQAMEKLDDYSGKASFLKLGDMVRVGSLDAFSTEELLEELAKRKVEIKETPGLCKKALNNYYDKKGSYLY